MPTMPRTTPKKARSSQPSVDGLAMPLRDDETLSAAEFVRRVEKANPGRRLSTILRLVSRASGVAEATLRLHVTLGREVRKPTAVKLAAWSGGWISAAKTLGIS
jgi:hypothetical protein